MYPLHRRRPANQIEARGKDIPACKLIGVDSSPAQSGGHGWPSVRSTGHVVHTHNFLFALLDSLPARQPGGRLEDGQRIPPACAG